MIRVNGLYQRLKRKVALLLALILTVQPFFSLDIGALPAFAAESEGRGTSYAYYDSSNLLKPGASFPFYGKDHNRVGLWPYGLTNADGGLSAPGYCLEPNKSMRAGTGGTFVIYDLDTDGDNLPLGITREEAEILWYALSSSGNFEGHQTGSSRVSQGHYILGQCATWAIMSGNWAGLDDFKEQMEALLANLKSSALATQTRGAMEQFFNQINGAVEEMAVPPFATKYQSTAPVHQMEMDEDGTYRLTLEYDSGDWRQSELVYDLPEGWSFLKEANAITFICTTGNPDIGLVKGHFPEGSQAAQYWVKPNTFKVWYPDGWDESSALEGKQAMITMAGELQPWEVWLSFGKEETNTNKGDYEIPYTQYLHEETFKRDYQVELEKQCSETGKTLEDAVFEILEQFDFSQLDGTNLEEEQFRKNLPDSEGKFSELTVCATGLMTDAAGRFTHSDTKKYEYEKTYCGGHPDPIIHYVEPSDDASEEESQAAEEENERLEQEAWAAWQTCVDWCEETCDFHSIDEGVARDELEEDRDKAWNTFINLKRVYTLRETTARQGYILHDLHKDDEQIEIVEFPSSQVEGEGEVTGYYPGNRKDTGAPVLSVSQNERNIVKATATPSEAEKEETEETKGHEAGNQEPEAEVPESETGTPETKETEPKEEVEKEELATPSNASSFLVKHPALRDSEGDTGDWEWDGIQEDSEVDPISQGEYPAEHIGYHYLVKDHRTEGELHINKRDKELFETGEDSYGKPQADATLEGAVYGLYAAEDIVHPDGKTGVVFKTGELVSIATTDKNGDASFLVITEVSDTSKNVENLYADNAEQNGNGWIGRPLILGSYYIEEISRSEGYELSRTGEHLTESNRTGNKVVLTESGSAHTTGFSHRINEWAGDSYDFTVDYFNTKGFDLYLSGLPDEARVYEVTEKETAADESVVTGSKWVEQTDADGNVVYQTAKGGEYKLDADGNKRLKFDEDGNQIYSDEPMTERVSAVNRLNVYVPAIEREEPSDPDMEDSSEIDEDYILWETSSALSMSGYKNGLSDAPWWNLKLSGDTNGEMIEEILKHCARDSFWDAYDVEAVYEKEGAWYAKIRYGYLALKNQTVLFEKGTGRLAVRKEYEDGYFYAIYEDSQYRRVGYRFLVEKKELDTEALADGTLALKTAYAPVYETYAAGEFLLDGDGQKIPQMVLVPVYEKQEVTVHEEILTPVDSAYDRETGLLHVYVDTASEDFTDVPLLKTFRVVVPEEIEQYQDAAVSVTTKKEPLEEGSYIKYALLLYPGQYEIYEDAGTRTRPILVLERVIKQAIRITKDIALDSYKNNTYEIHRDPFTVLFGGYNGKQETKTLPGFFFKLYLRSDLEETGQLQRKEDGSCDYEKFFSDNPEYQTSLALDWDVEQYDADGDMTTVHANQGGGKDDYWGQSRMMPYGTYVLVEQQPFGIPQKHYRIDAPQEVEIPFVPQIDGDGTVHDKIPATEYLYDSHMTPEELMEQYYIRFNEETHVIKAHNNDGDFEVFKYGLEPDSRKDCGNEVVAGYYRYGSISEDAKTADGVYYETYYDRDGNIADYGVTMDNVASMTGKSIALDRVYAKALVPWCVLDPRYGAVIDDAGNIGNREAGLSEEGNFNFISFAGKDFENELYSSRLRIEKLDAETGENILHDGALFKIYAAQRDILGNGASGVTGSGDILFDENGIPLYDESEAIIMQDDTGAEVGIFKAYSTIRDGEVTEEDGTVHTEKQCVGYLETYQTLGAGAYVLVEIEAPEGYVKSKPIAFTVYSDKVEYYEDGDAGKKTQAVKYQYMRPVGADGKVVVEDMHQIIVRDQPTHIKIHKIEKSQESLTYRVEGDEEQLKKRGDVTLQYKPNGEFAGFGYVTKQLEETGGPVANATLTLYEGLTVTKTGEHEYDGVKVSRNLFDSVTGITAYKTGVDTDIRKTGTDAVKRDEWDITEEANPPAPLWFFDLDYDPTERDTETGILYGLDDWGNRICMLDSETGMAYVTDGAGEIIVWPVDKNGDKIISQSVELYTDENGKQTINTDLIPVTDENGLPVYYKDGGVTWVENEWVTSGEGAGFEIARVKQGAYILEETAAPLSDGYVQSAAIGLVVKDTSGLQSFYMENDFTKLELSKLDMTSREEIEGAALTLYEAYRVYDDSDRGWHLEILRDMDGEPVEAASWVSEGKTPHWIDHIMPGDYILRETRVPTKSGYVTAEDVEVIIEETGKVQAVLMEDDHTAVEMLKVDAKTGKVMDQEHRATLALYPALLDEDGEARYDEEGKLLYDAEKPIYKWLTDDGSEVRKTAHPVSIPGGHTYIAYDYEIRPVPGTVQAVAYVTETGAMRFEYLPVGKYVLVEEKAPHGYTVADPVYVPVLDVGSKDRVQSVTMEDEPIRVLLTKVNQKDGKEIAGATVAVYRAASDGTLAKYQMTDSNGNLLYVTDLEGNLLKDPEGNLIPAMKYDETYLADRWISGSDGRYTKKEETNGLIPEGYEAGDLKPHELESPVAGSYYFVEEQTPFGYTRAAELPFEIVDTMGVQKFELVNELILGQLEIVKSDARDQNTRLFGARFKFTNLDTNSAVILITDTEGRAVSSLVPIGSVGADGSVSLYRFRVEEVGAPAGYLLDQNVQEFRFNVITDRYPALTFRYEAEDRPNKVIISKKILTTKEELPGAQLEVRAVRKTVGEDGEIILEEGDIIERFISTETPHEIECLAPGDYVLIETKAPDGYLEAEKVYFTVKKDMEEILFVEMFDDDTKTEIKKVDSETKEPLSGVKLELLLAETKEVIKEWVTNSTGVVQFYGLPAGEYLLREVEAPDGYQLLSEPLKITVSKDYKVQTFVMENQKTEVFLEKRDAETREPVAGAVLQLLDAGGTLVKEWTSIGEPETFRGLKAGWYTIQEVKPADGYLPLKEPQKIRITNQEGVQRFTVTNQKIEVDISKRDKETGEPLPGAMLRLLDQEHQMIREWVSGQVPEVFKGLTPGRYTLEELSAPDGYAVAKSMVIEVAATEERQEFTLDNEKIVTEFQKTDGISGGSVTGAVLQLIKNAGTEGETVIKEWKTKEEPLVIKGIPSGIYTVREIKTPEGYVPMQDIQIEIRDDEPFQQFTVVNHPVQFEIEKVSGNTGNLLGGALLQLVRNRDGAVIREWTSKDGEAERFTSLAPGIYTVRELKAPSGYKKMEPQKIVIREMKELQEFIVVNYKITHSGGGGGDTPKPSEEYMKLYKVDGATGQKLAGAKFTIYDSENRVYAEGITNAAGIFRFKKPQTGTYTFKETEAPDGYYLNEAVFTFTVTASGVIEGDTTMEDYKKGNMMISKVDVTTAEELPGAEIEVTDQDGNTLFHGTSDEHGKVSFPVPAPGIYHFREVVAPDGYDLNETVFTFTVFEDGSILGDHTVTDQKHYGTITAQYGTERRGEGNLTVGQLLHAPKTGDTSNLVLMAAAWFAAVGGLLLFGLWKWRRRRKKRSGMGASMLLLAVILAAGLTTMQAQAAEEVIDTIYEEHQYTTDTPDSDEAERLFQKELERDGTKYRLSEIRTEVIGEQGKNGSKSTFELATSPFLEGKTDVQPESQIEKEGSIYRLKESKKEPAVIPAHEVPVKQEVFYEAVEALDVIPRTIQVAVTDSATGQEKEVQAEISGQTFENERWEDTFSFPAVFHEYGLDGYWIGEQVFLLSGDEPDFTGYEETLLALIEADKENYAIEAARWDGEAYTDEAGILCRKVTVTGAKRVSDCTVTYVADALFEEEDGVRLLSTYEKDAGSEDREGKTYTIKATGVYVPKKNHGVVIAAVIGLTGAGAGSAGYTYHRRKKRRQGPDHGGTLA